MESLKIVHSNIFPFKECPPPFKKCPPPPSFKELSCAGVGVGRLRIIKQPICLIKYIFQLINKLLNTRIDYKSTLTQRYQTVFRFRSEQKQIQRYKTIFRFRSEQEQTICRFRSDKRSKHRDIRQCSKQKQTYRYYILYRVGANIEILDSLQSRRKHRDIRHCSEQRYQTVFRVGAIIEILVSIQSKSKHRDIRQCSEQEQSIDILGSIQSRSKQRYQTVFRVGANIEILDTAQSRRKHRDIRQCSEQKQNIDILGSIQSRSKH